MQKKSLFLLAAAAFLAVPATIALTTDEASAMDIITDDEDFTADWELKFYADDRYFDCITPVNKKTGAKLPAGWHTVNGAWFYFTKDGYTFDEFHSGYYLGSFLSGGEYFDDEHVKKFDWVKDSQGWKYVLINGDNEEQADWVSWLANSSYRIDGKVYFFGEGAHLRKAGWCQDEAYDVYDEAWYYIQSDGSCATGWKKIGGKWYFFDQFTGRMLTGGQDTSAICSSEKKPYFFDKNGALREKAGWAQESFEDQGGSVEWYYLDNAGQCCTGWKQIGKSWYYFNDYQAGRMAHSYTISSPYELYEHTVYVYVDGYYIDKNGVCKDGGYKWKKDSLGSWYGKGSYYEKDSEALIDGQSCYFDQLGYLMSYYDNRTHESWSREGAG